MGIIILYDFQDEEDNPGAEFAVLGRVHLSGVPQRHLLTKENTLKPGPWNDRPHRTLKTAVPVSQPQQPSFECENPFICVALLQNRLYRSVMLHIV
jgi:hypothetical protein